MPAPISALIFDIGNVLLPLDYSQARQRLFVHRNEMGSSLARDEVITGICKEYEHGRIGRAEFIRTIKETFAYQGSDESFIEVWCDIFEENTVLHLQIPILAKTYPLYLSNIGCIHREFIHARYSVFTHFTAGVYSYEVGAMKPSHLIYQIATESFGVVPENTLFIDDLPENVEGARAAGFHGFVYDWHRHDLFETALASYNIALPHQNFSTLQK